MTHNNRNRNPLAQFREAFCPTLMNRLYPRIKWYMDVKDTYLLFINILDRSNDHSVQKEHLIYAGVKAQTELLPVGPQSLEVNWKFLQQDSLHIDDSNESKKTIKRISNQTYSLDYIEVKDLKNYFRRYFEEGTFANRQQENEYSILKHYFDIDKDHYLSLPIIQFGWVDGIVHIIFKDSDLNALQDRKNWKKLIKLFSVEYEALLINWDLANKNTTWDSILTEDMDYVESKQYEAMTEKNPIFKELNFKEYYRNAGNYYRQRLKSNYILLKAEHRKRAIIAILIDSYAHNISAHSLTVLKWWFQQRATYLDITSIKSKMEREFPFENWGASLTKFLCEKFPGFFSEEDMAEGIKGEAARWYGQLLDKKLEKTPFRAVRDQIFSLSPQLAPLFKYLLEKGAFWSGITRDKHFGGEITNFYDLFWKDFVQNSLYLGTIAYSEGISKLQVHFRIYSGRDFHADEDVYWRVYEIKRDKAGHLLDGEFAKIDIVGKQEQALQNDFLIEGELHEPLKAELESYEVFLPGGVVGKHALFTLIENEIRNVRHYNREDLSKMKKNGLDLIIGIRPSTLSKSFNYTDKSMYKIGIWIGMPSELYDGDDHYVSKRFSKQLEDVITEETHRPKLGGAFQDKICAAMLFNGTFNSVENRNTVRDSYYYPWVRSAFSEGVDLENEEKEMDFEVQNRNKVQADIYLLDKEKNSKKGYIKKYFHIWQGANIYHLQHSGILKEENIARFRLVNVVDGDEHLLREVRSRGIVRVLTNLPLDISWEEAYRAWLSIWVKEKEGRINFLLRHTEVGQLVFDQNAINFYHQEEYLQLPQEEQERYVDYPFFDLGFAHGSSKLSSEVERKVLNIRSDGVLSNKFFQNLPSIEEFDQGTISKRSLYELLEVLQTRICIFDQRIAERLSGQKRAFLNEQLSCGIYGENAKDWENVKVDGLSKYHFIIVHLAFVESYIDKTGKHYGEEGIVRFMDEQIGDQLSDNCILVLTTGRGRERWWKRLQDSKYAYHTTFRPVEMLIDAVESAGLIKDDIDLKYNLIKVLFGS